MVVDASKLRFDLKFLVLILTAAWTPALAIGGGMITWAHKMDQRVTIQETQMSNTIDLIRKLDATVNGDVRELRNKVENLQLEVATLKASAK